MATGIGRKYSRLAGAGGREGCGAVGAHPARALGTATPHSALELGTGILPAYVAPARGTIVGDANSWESPGAFAVEWPAVRWPPAARTPVRAACSGAAPCVLPGSWLRLLLLVLLSVVCTRVLIELIIISTPVHRIRGTVHIFAGLPVLEAPCDSRLSRTDTTARSVCAPRARPYVRYTQPAWPEAIAHLPHLRVPFFCLAMSLT